MVTYEFISCDLVYNNFPSIVLRSTFNYLVLQLHLLFWHDLTFIFSTYQVIFQKFGLYGFSCRIKIRFGNHIDYKHPIVCHITTISDRLRHPVHTPQLSGLISEGHRKTRLNPKKRLESL